jgi:hypothetical protein
MSTRYVVTECCAAPVVLVGRNFECEAAHLVCVRCGREAGSPGAEDSEAVQDLLNAPACLVSLADCPDVEVAQGRVIFS